MLDNHAISSEGLSTFYQIDGKRFQKQYKEKLSNFQTWDQGKHAEDYILNINNISPHLALDETAMTNGELYTILSNKSAKAKKGSIIAMVKGTRSEDVMKVLKKIPQHKRNIVQEITLDMASNMNLIAKTCFPNGKIVTDRFHVQKLAVDAVQEVRIRLRWEAIDHDNKCSTNAKKKGKKYVPKVLENGDTHRQLLARARYLLFKTPNKWTNNQKVRAGILFREYPVIEKAYQLLLGLVNVYNSYIEKGVALTKFARWFKDVEDAGFKSFETIKKSFEIHYNNITNYFDNRSTNAYAESFNAKIKDFRRIFRGVRDLKFFLFRLNNIFG